MKIKSFVFQDENLVPVEVEISLHPGLPTIQFLGLPDQVIKESVHRIRSALKAQGFEFPKAQTIYVNLRPNNQKKTSRGLELAVAVGILLATEQLVSDSSWFEMSFYGELGLSGEVYAPEDLVRCRDEGAVVSGQGVFAYVHLLRAECSTLKQLHDLVWLDRREVSRTPQRPSILEQALFTDEQAFLLKLAARGRHHLLLAGPAGVGKTTMAKALWALLPEPRQEELENWYRDFSLEKQNEFIAWAPLVQPHHSLTPLAMIGGGVPLFKGEISRAHGGVLVLDELLEFHPKVQEALREPMEEGALRVARGREVAVFASQAQVVATTNLCPCGKWLPQSRVMCARSVSRCRSYREHLSGPLMDRFQLLELAKKRTGGAHSLASLVAELAEIPPPSAVPAAYLQRGELEAKLAPRAQSLWPEFSFSSQRRELATLRVAKTLSEIEGKDQIELEHLQRVLPYTSENFEKMASLD